MSAELIGILAMGATLLVGLGGLVLALQTRTDKRSDAMEARLDAAQAQTAKRFDAMEAQTAKRFDAMEAQTAKRFDAMEAQTAKRFDAMEDRLDEMQGDLRRLGERVARSEGRMEGAGLLRVVSQSAAAGD